MSEDPPYIPPSEDMTEDERELAQEIANLLWWSKKRQNVFDDSPLVVVQDFVKKIVELGWVPESEIRHAEYERDAALQKIDSLRAQVEAFAEGLDKQLEAESAAEGPIEVDEDDFDSIEVMNHGGQIIATYKTGNQSGKSSIQDEIEQVSKSLARQRMRAYTKNFKWRDL